MFNAKYLKPTWLLAIPMALVMVLSLACGSDESPAPTPIDVAAIVQQAIGAQPAGISQDQVAAAIASALAAQPGGVTAADMAMAIQSELAKQPGVSQTDVTAAITKALEAQQPGITQDQVAAAIRTALAGVPTATPQPTPQILGGELVKLGGIVDMQAYAAPGSGMFFAPINYNNYHLQGITNQIVQFNPETEDRLDVRGDLARDWDVSADGMTYSFNIREGVKFHDGTPLTMDDIFMSMQGWFEPNESDVPLVKDSASGKVSSQARAVLSYMTSFRAVDANTLEVKLKFPSAAFLTTFAREAFHVLSKPAYVAGTGFTYSKPETVIGTGPFKLANYTKDVSTEWEKNEDYFREGRPFLDGIRNFIITDHGAVIAAFKSGQVHMNAGWNSNLSMSEGAKLAEEVGDKMNIYVGGPFFTLGVMMNTRVGTPWDDPRVRKAMNLVLHRQPILETTSGGRNLLGTPIPPGFSWSFPLEEGLQMPGFREAGGVKDPQDIAEAQKLMVAAGLGPGYKTQLTCRTVIEFCDVAVLVKAQLKEFLGWDITIRQMESVAGMTAYVSGDFEFAVMANSFSFPDADASGASYRKGSTSDNARTGYFNPEAEKLWDPIAKERNPAKRKALVRQANDILLEDNSWPYIYYVMQMMFLDKVIKGYHPPPSLGAYQAWEAIWCDPSCR